MKPFHPWIARLSVSVFMLALAFIGLVVTNIQETGGWNYWRWVVPLYALAALGLSWYLRRKEHSLSPVTLWHELLHWLGVIAAVFLTSFFVREGIVGRFEAALTMLTLMALGIFLAGIYIETTFLFVGMALGAFAAIIAFIDQYLYAITVPLLFVAIGALVWTVWHHRHTPPTP